MTAHATPLPASAIPPAPQPVAPEAVRDLILAVLDALDAGDALQTAMGTLAANHPDAVLAAAALGAGQRWHFARELVHRAAEAADPIALDDLPETRAEVARG